VKPGGLPLTGDEASNLLITVLSELQNALRGANERGRWAWTITQNTAMIVDVSSRPSLVAETVSWSDVSWSDGFLTE